jgi:hypothetical protein
MAKGGTKGNKLQLEGSQGKHHSKVSKTMARRGANNKHLQCKHPSMAR